MYSFPMPASVERFCKNCPYYDHLGGLQGFCRIESAHVGDLPFPLVNGLTDWCYIIRPELEKELRRITAQ